MDDKPPFSDLTLSVPFTSSQDYSLWAEEHGTCSKHTGDFGTKEGLEIDELESEWDSRAINLARPETD